MRAGKLALSAAALTMFLIGAQGVSAEDAANLDNATCLSCHGEPGFATQDASGQAHSLFVSSDRFAHSVHGMLPLQCITCHTTITQIPHNNSPLTSAQGRQQIPARCGSCHAAALNDYLKSVHGKQVMEGSDVNAAVCTDCHTAHAVAGPQIASTRIAMTKDCGACHPEALASYTKTYHGQILALGYADTATCADCHRGHAILPAGDPASSVSSANLLNTCRACHQGATPGFGTFQPHATTDNFAQYPYTWIASKFVNIAVGGVLVFFWVHSALWFYREFRDRQQHKLRPHVRADAVPRGQDRYYQRWSALWRWVHLIFAVSIILLVATGLPLHYPTASWAPPLERAMGGPEIAGLVHRVAAVIMVAVFAGHVAYAAIHIALNWKTFKVFGPYSLMPNWQDAADFVAMFKWFFGRGPRPMFDYWNYQQKVDYWAPFWGIAMLVTTGAMLWFKTLTAAYLPGWAFNVATVAHGDEALLAAAYLFTVHYFVNHWRPDKFPLDVVIFTGSMPLEEFKREYGVEYARLVETGELQQHLVDAPSRPLTLGAKIVGFSLVAVGLALFVMMVIGFGGTVMSG